ncbi:MAG: hypothetical protein WC977_05900 [Anaerovoracaceae bacterium]|jgi:hypothetical protein
MGRFTDAEAVVRYDLSDGDWVEFRQDLSFAERRAVEAGALKGRLNPETKTVDMDVDWEAFEVSRLAGWIRAWSLTDEGKAVPPTRQWISRLSVATATELTALLDRHLEAVDGEEKKGNGGH